MRATRTEKASPLFELALVLVRLDHFARRIVNANHCIMRAAVKSSFGARSRTGRAVLFSGWAILDRLHLLRGLVSLLWRDQYRYS
jgi:hypothetical protein